VCVGFSDIFWRNDKNSDALQELLRVALMSERLLKRLPFPQIFAARALALSLKGWQKFLWQRSLILAVAASAARVEFQKHYK
jgi:hypothetical protein